MADALKYIVDENGNKTSVLVPIKQWKNLNDDYKKLQKKLEVFNNIQKGLREVERARKTGRKLQTLNEFLK